MVRELLKRGAIRKRRVRPPKYYFVKCSVLNIWILQEDTALAAAVRKHPLSMISALRDAGADVKWKGWVSTGRT